MQTYHIKEGNLRFKPPINDDPAEMYLNFTNQTINKQEDIP